MRHIIEHRRSRWTPPCTPGRASTRKTRARRGRTRARCAGRSPRWPKAQRPRPQTGSMATGLHATKSRTGAVGRERFANGASGRKLLLEIHESATLFTTAISPFSKSVLSLFWVILFEIPESIAFTSPTPNSAPDDSKHFKTSFSPCLIRCSSSGNQRQYLGAAR